MAPSNRQKGVALAMVVWFLAAMSLLVSGIVFQAKVDTRLAQLHVAKAKAAAVGDGAIQLMMAKLVAGNLEELSQDSSGSAFRFQVGEYSVVVNSVPVAGLIDLNRAPLDILTAMYIERGKLDESQALTLASKTIQWRSARSPGNRSPQRFRSVEDLLRVEGVNRAMLDSLRDVIATGDSRRAAINWSVAPRPVLDILAIRNPERAASIFGSRQLDAPANKTTGRLGAANRARSYRLDAVVFLGDQQWLRRRWAVSQSARAGNVPWRFVRTEAPRVFTNAGTFGKEGNS